MSEIDKDTSENLTRLIKSASEVATDQECNVRVVVSPSGPILICQPGECTRANKLREALEDIQAALMDGDHDAAWRIVNVTLQRKQ